MLSFAISKSLAKPATTFASAIRPLRKRTPTCPPGASPLAAASAFGRPERRDRPGPWFGRRWCRRRQGLRRFGGLRGSCDFQRRDEWNRGDEADLDPQDVKNRPFRGFPCQRRPLFLLGEPPLNCIDLEIGAPCDDFLCVASREAAVDQHL